MYRASYKYAYAVAVGKQNLLRPNGFEVNESRNESVIKLIYKDVLGLEEVMKEAYRIYIEDGTYLEKEFLMAVDSEFNLTGRVSIMMDSTYTVDERIIMVNVYKQTGIDLRVVDNVENILKDFERKLENLEIDYDDICIEMFTIDEMKLYRQMSNQFREDRFNQVKRNNLGVKK